MLAKLVADLNKATSVEEAELFFPKIADVLLNKSLLEVNGKDYRLMEIEFYFLPVAYDEPFVHGFERQSLSLEWYFHRKGQTLQDKTRKGLDLTIGNGPNRGGILIRAVQNLATSKYKEGSSSFVELLMNEFNERDIKSLAHEHESKSPFDSSSKLKLKYTDQLAPIKSTMAPRHGLALKKKKLELRKQFIFKLYRYLSEPQRTEYGIHNIFLSLIQQGSTPEAASEFLKIRKSDVDKYLAAYERGKSLSPDIFVGIKNMGVYQQCELMGALQKYKYRS